MKKVYILLLFTAKLAIGMESKTANEAKEFFAITIDNPNIVQDLRVVTYKKDINKNLEKLSTTFEELHSLANSGPSMFSPDEFVSQHEELTSKHIKEMDAIKEDIDSAEISQFSIDDARVTDKNINFFIPLEKQAKGFAVSFTTGEGLDNTHSTFFVPVQANYLYAISAKSENVRCPENNISNNESVCIIKVPMLPLLATQKTK